MRHIVDTSCNHKRTGSCESDRNGNGGDLIHTAFEICVLVNTLEVLLLLNKLFSWPKRWFIHLERKWERQKTPVKARVGVW